MKEVEKILQHHGIKGMRWGVRRSRTQIDSASPDAQAAKAIRSQISKGNTDKLSNDDLGKLVTRMNLETQYSKLASAPKKRNPAAKFVADVLVGVAKTQATKVANDQVTKLVSKHLRSAVK